MDGKFNKLSSETLEVNNFILMIILISFYTNHIK